MDTKKKMILIIGRSGCGKDTCAKYLSERYGLKQLKSYATRPKRTDDEDTHVFIRKEDVADYKDDIVAYTAIGEYEYFATRNQIETSDIYIIDPDGYYELKSHMPDTKFIVVYVTCHPETAKVRAMARRPMYMAEEKAIFEARHKAEDARFTDFETNHKNDIDLLVYNRTLPDTQDLMDQVYLRYIQE